MKRCWILPVLLLGACGEEPAVEAGAGAGAESAQAAAPDAARAELVPPYPGAVAVEVPNLGAPGTDSRSGNATASETSDSPEQVAAFYRERFAADGMPIRADSMGPTGGVMAIGRDGEQGAMLTVSRIGERTRIAVIQRR
jgi:outer membrane receptor protein involved in Fe transport